MLRLAELSALSSWPEPAALPTEFPPGLKRVELIIFNNARYFLMNITKKKVVQKAKMCQSCR